MIFCGPLLIRKSNIGAEEQIADDHREMYENCIVIVWWRKVLSAHDTHLQYDMRRQRNDSPWRSDTIRKDKER